MPKINVYLPDDLAAEVKAAGISVSPVCQTALEEEVRKMKALQTLGSDDRLAAAKSRIADSRREAEEECHENGKRDGREWAIERATHQELSRFENWYESTSWPFERVSIDDPERFPTAYYWLDDSLSRVEADEQDSFTASFVEGALEAWDAIRASDN